MQRWPPIRYQYQAQTLLYASLEAPIHFDSGVNQAGRQTTCKPRPWSTSVGVSWLLNRVSLTCALQNSTSTSTTIHDPGDVVRRPPRRDPRRELAADPAPPGVFCAATCSACARMSVVRALGVSGQSGSWQPPTHQHLHVGVGRNHSLRSIQGVLFEAVLSHPRLRIGLETATPGPRMVCFRRRIPVREAGEARLPVCWEEESFAAGIRSEAGDNTSPWGFCGRQLRSGGAALYFYRCPPLRDE